MDRFEAMALLVEIVERGSFSAAARALRMPVTTVSRKISDLEETLGARLLTRTTRQISLTDTGANYLAAARRIIEQVEDAEREAAGEFIAPKGRLVVTAPIQFGQLHVLPVVSEFLAHYPQIDVRLVLLDRNVALIEDHVDMAIRVGKLPDSSMISTTLGSFRTVICGTPDLFARHGTPRTPDDLARLPCVTFDGPVLLSGWQLFDPQSRAPIVVPVQPRLSVNSIEAVLRAALGNVGITRLLCYQVADAINAGKLRVVMKEYEPEPSPVSIIHAARGQMPLKTRLFLDFATPRLRKSLVSID